jgi:sigma-E factor negative regulatory protein RseC
VLPDNHTVEGIARVVRIADGMAWLEPEQTTSCGSCASAAACGSGATGIGTVASRIQARRFAIDNPADLMVGERVVVGVADRALIKATLTAYGLPLLTAFAVAGFAESTWSNDLVTMMFMVAGLISGLILARISAFHLGARGELAPRFLRRARPSETCDAN